MQSIRNGPAGTVYLLTSGLPRHFNISSKAENSFISEILPGHCVIRRHCGPWSYSHL